MQTKKNTDIVLQVWAYMYNVNLTKTTVTEIVHKENRMKLMDKEDVYNSNRDNKAYLYLKWETDK